MIPFARIVKYGNILPEAPKIKKVSTSTGGIFILYDNGELYCLGGQGFGNFGLGDNSPRTTWTLTNTNVRDFYSSNYTTFIIKNDDTTYWCGLQYTMLATGSSSTQVWTQITTISPVIPLNTIVDMKFGQYSTLILDNAGNMYGMGYNLEGALGSGTVGARYGTPFLIKSGVLKISIHNRSAAHIDTANKVWFAGYNANGQFGNNNTTQVNTWTQSTSTTVVTTYPLITDVVAGSDFVQLIAQANSSTKKVLLFAGNAAFGGNGATSGNQLTFALSTQFNTNVTAATPVKLMPSQQSSNTVSVIATTGIYSVGNGNQYGNGNGSTAVLSSYVLSSGTPTPTDYNEFLFPGKMLSGTVFVYNGKLYGTGSVFTPSHPTYSIDTTVPYYIP